MKLTLSRTAIAAAMAAVSRVVERRNTIPILGNVLLDATAGGLRLNATDLDMEASVTLPAEIEAPGVVTAPADTLAAICRSLPDVDEVRLELREEALRGGTLHLSAGRARFRLQTLPASDFPDIAPGEFSHRFEISGRALGRLIAKSKFAISTEETRHYLCGIYLHVVDLDDGPMLTAVATDGHRLARIRTPAPEGATGMPGVIVPRKAVGEIGRMAEAADKADLLVEVSPERMRVSLEGATFVTKMIDGHFPDYKRVIPAEGSRRAVVETKALTRALSRVSAVGSAGSRAVRFGLDEARMTIEMRNADVGEASEELEIALDGEPMEIGLNCAYAEAILSVLDVERVAIALSDPGSPMLWAEAREEGGDEQPNALYVLMPMRV